MIDLHCKEICIQQYLQWLLRDTLALQVAPFKLTASSDASRPGVQLDLPNMMGSKQKFKNSRDQECTAWDFVVHPSAMQHMAAKPAFQETLVEMVSVSVLVAATSVSGLQIGPVVGSSLAVGLKTRSQQHPAAFLHIAGIGNNHSTFCLAS